jgi:hypothetical protein
MPCEPLDMIVIMVHHSPMIVNPENVTNYAKNRWAKKPPFWIDFWQHVSDYGNNSCWNWKHRKNSRGYGTLKILSKSVLAHRYAWEITNGEIKNGFCVCHKCDNTACCNPSHMFLGSRADNNADKMTKGRHRAHKGVEHYKARISEEEVIKIRHSFRIDKTPYRVIAKEWGIPSATIYSIVSGRTWKHLP